MIDEELKNEFERNLSYKVQLCIKDVYRPQYLINLAAEEGYYIAAKKLITKPENTEGFTKLLLEGRVDLSIENLVVQPEYTLLFSKEEIRMCKQRLGR
ncbi:hypothetical protein CXF68_01985 [Tenacibaculum sp. Bg11-29]|uniref:hypothetical protein n=1 Tax=Tenacibaculum sp. Bg11-29 TaxID=2058306 RepID=UPI000C34181C|nr:hypothetical protein [Tenacibaculum sp. Bg11-29]PKH49533.1 hypothetical protein CXF68_01985 [Tenacibaculum sp. Bg11-29]